MRLFRQVSPFRRRRRKDIPNAGQTLTAKIGGRTCRFEMMEPRRMLAADLLLGAVYFEEATGDDSQGDVIEVSYVGGAAGTQLTRITIDGDKQARDGRPGDGLTTGDVFFDIASGGHGAFGAVGLTILSHDGFDVTGVTVVDGGTQIIFDLVGFNAGEKLRFSLDVDEASFVDEADGIFEATSVVEGGEFQRSHIIGSFVAPTYEDIQLTATFWDSYDDEFAAAASAAGSTLALPNDRYSPDQDYSDRTAGAVSHDQQIPLPISIAGTVFLDSDVDNLRDPGEQGIAGVTLNLWVLNTSTGQYQQTGKQTVTDANGNYEFNGDDGQAILPGRYEIRESQPSGYFSVGAKAGTVGGVTKGVVVNSDTLGQIDLVGGMDSIRNDFAEALPSRISGRVHANTDGNCDFNPGDIPLANVRVDLLNAQGTVVATKFTGADGRYAFENLAPGAYTVFEHQPQGYYDGGDHPGSAGGTVTANDTIAGITLTSGTNAVDYNFCEHVGVTLSGYVYHDRDNDGQRDAGEEGIAGVTVRLLGPDGQPLGPTTTTTSASGQLGYYEFTNLAAGTYGVVEVQPSGWLDGLDTPGNRGGTASNPPPGDRIVGAVINYGTTGLNYNFGELRPSSISGRVHADLDGDCVLDPDEVTIENVQIDLRNAQGVVIATTFTNAQGRYLFDNLRPGEYQVFEHQPEGYYDGDEHVGSAGGTLSANDTIVGITLTSGTAAVEYNFCELVPSSISGRVHADLDGDCELDPDETPLENVQIDLRNAQGVVIATTYTDAEGRYLFDNLAPGEYQVFEHQPEGYFDGADHVGSAGGALAANDTIVGITLTSGTAAVEYNFCELVPSSISGRVHADLDGDCVLDPGEVTIENVRIDLRNAQGVVIATTYTNAQGRYLFDNLAPGEYQVFEHQPQGYFDSGDHIGSAGGTKAANDLLAGIILTSGTTAVDYNFCEHVPGSISGRVHADLDGDCELDPDETPLENVRIDLRNAQGVLIATTYTNAQGRYLFDNLAPGEYQVFEHQPEGYYDGADHVGSAGGTLAANDTIVGITLTSGTAAVEYNFCELVPSSISGRVHADLDGDCELDPGEKPIENVQIDLVDAQGTVIATTFTDAEGQYLFDNLAPGTYQVVEHQPRGYFDSDDHVGSAGGTLADNDTILGITLTSGTIAVDYNFCEVPPGKISGYVFQDGTAVSTPDGQVPGNLHELRDGSRTGDDTPLAGVTLELRHGVTGEPVLADQALPGFYADGPIRTTTNARGYYEFRGLPAGTYAVYEVHPDSYVDGIDTAGSRGGMAVNPSDNPNPLILAQLTVDPADDAIIRIPLPPGANATENNFSEVRIVHEPPIVIPPPRDPLPPLMPLVAPLPPMEPMFVLPAFPLPIVPPYIASGSGVIAYTWHLSVVDAGQPRSADARDVLVQFTGKSFDAISWRARDLQRSEWTIQRDGEELDHRVIFGMPGAIPVTGDFNGDGISEVGVFLNGEWFIDVNGNGVWDEGDLWAQLGTEGDLPVTGDWDGDGKTDIGIFGRAWPGDPRAIAEEPGLPDPHNPLLGKKKNVPPTPDEAAKGGRAMKLTSQGQVRMDLIDHVFHYGVPGDVPITGDWNGMGIETIGVFRDGRWHLDIDGDGRFTDRDKVFEFGRHGDLPVVGDWDGNGVDQIGVYRNGTWIVDTDGNRELDARDKVFELGSGGDLPVVGDWNGDGVDEPAVYHPHAAPATGA